MAGLPAVGLDAVGLAEMAAGVKAADGLGRWTVAVGGRVPPERLGGAPKQSSVARLIASGVVDAAREAQRDQRGGDAAALGMRFGLG